jgi:hypothetical protein
MKSNFEKRGRALRGAFAKEPVSAPKSMHLNSKIPKIYKGNCRSAVHLLVTKHSSERGNQQPLRERWQAAQVGASRPRARHTRVASADASACRRSAMRSVYVMLSIPAGAHGSMRNGMRRCSPRLSGLTPS